jgi:hypothetical protein
VRDAAVVVANRPDRSTHGEAGDPPVTPTEVRLAAAWAEVLGTDMDRISRRDHFFDRGGSSLAMLRLAIALDRALTPADIRRYPVLADLAGLIDGRSERDRIGEPAAAAPRH